MRKIVMAELLPLAPCGVTNFSSIPGASVCHSGAPLVINALKASARITLAPSTCAFPHLLLKKWITPVILFSIIRQEMPLSAQFLAAVVVSWPPSACSAGRLSIMRPKA
jgi:hypothetical protein